MKLDELNAAIFDNDLKKLEQLLKAGVSPNQNDCNGMCPLFHAVNFASLEAVKLLLDYGADINQTSRRGKTAWLLAVETEDVEKIDLLHSRGANSSAQNEMGQTGLHYAAMRGKEDLFQRLLEYARDETLLVDHWGNTVLHLAAAWHNLPLVKICLTKNLAPIDSINHSMETAFLRAIKAKQLKIAEMLLDANCDITTPDKNRNYPLLALVRSFKYEPDGLDFLKTLIVRGCSINEANYEKETPLLISVIANHTSFIQLLLNNDANVNCQDKNGATPLLIAVKANNRELTKTLLDAHANPEIKDNNRISPLIAAIQQNSLELVELLLTYNANVHDNTKEMKDAIRDVKNSNITQLLNMK